MVISRIRSDSRVEVDVQALRAMGRRFAMHHRQRYLDALAKLDGRKRDILAALPMFFHVNHAALPGYVQNAPCGIVGHLPTPSDITAIHRFARSFSASLASQRHDIDAIFLMGSGGSLGHTADSDIDLWVCCPQQLHDKLRPKLTKIEQWATEEGLALQGFLVDPSFFHDTRDLVHGPLLLDEFYRSGIHLAGKHPLWWYVDGSSEASYASSANHLLAQRFIAPQSVLNFGAVGKPGVDALCRAGALELGRALTTPHKSLLKLALVEAYLGEPERPLLSSHYQRLMLTGVPDISRLDTYYMLYEYLATTKSNRPWTFTQADLRWLFVRKIVSRARELPPSSLIAREILDWGYSGTLLQNLRQPFRQDLTTALAELTITTQLQRKGVQFGRRLAMLEPSLSTEIDGMESALERFSMPGEEGLRPMNAALMPSIRPVLEVRMNRHNWRLYENGQVLRAAATWVELLLWLLVNGINTGNLKMPTPWFDQAHEALRTALESGLEHLLIINPLPDPHDAGERLITAFDDPLSYGGLRVCKARLIYHLHLDPDQPTLTEHIGTEGVLAVLLDALNRSQPTRAFAISREDHMLVHRLESLQTQAKTALHTAARFDFPLGSERIHLIRSADQSVGVAARVRV